MACRMSDSFDLNPQVLLAEISGCSRDLGLKVDQKQDEATMGKTKGIFGGQ